jgi:hypothetical protein
LPPIVLLMASLSPDGAVGGIEQELEGVGGTSLTPRSYLRLR